MLEVGGTRLPLNQLCNLVGRASKASKDPAPTVDLSSFDAMRTVSRRHAEIRWRGGQFLVVDVGSSNGTRVASSKLPPRVARQLEDGDALVFGQVAARFLRSAAWPPGTVAEWPEPLIPDPTVAGFKPLPRPVEPVPGGPRRRRRAIG